MTTTNNSRICGRITLAIFITIIISLPVHAKYSGGTGEPNTPYQISTVADWQTLMNTSADWKKSFIMTADIDMNDVSLIPVGTFYSKAFMGVFDGNDHIIRNADINMPTSMNVGLFGYIGTSGQIRNLGTINVTITGSQYVGGLVGENYGSVTQCYSTGTVSGSWYVGGLVGYNDGDTMTQCYSTSTVNGSQYYVGGLVGSNYYGIITQCFSTGTFSGSWYVGGLVGENYGTVTQCYSTGVVDGNNFVGGLVGINLYGTVTQCYSIGEVDGNDYVGGLVGSRYIYGGSTVTSSFWDTQTSGTLDGFGGIDPDPNGVTGKTTSEMKTKSTFTDAGWDFVSETVNGPNDIWKIVEGLDYPRLSWEKYSGGSGKPNDPFRIATVDDMILLGDSSGDYDKHFILIADIDFDPNLPGRKIFDKAVIAPDMNDNDDGQFQGTPFTGSFDGNSHVIRNLYIAGSEHLGLFGYLVSPSGSVVNVHNLGLEAVDVSGIGDFIGGLAGENKGRIRLCYSTGTVTGTGDNVGGLVGWNNEGDVIQCYSTCLVNGNNSVGGLVGNNYYSGVANCYSTGTVSGTGDNVGGLVGMNIGDATNVTASFWDVNTSGQTISAGGTGKATVDMWNVQTYQGAGWDFLGEIQDGLHEVWQMPEGGGYPVISIFNGYTPPELQGLGTPENPYLISNALELGAIFYYRSDSYYRLIADINLADISWGEAVVPQFAGFFDGNDHIVSRLTIQGQYYLGLFGRLESGAELRDLGVVDVNITGSSSWSGGLAGSNNGTVTHCYSTGAASGVNRIGGLVGMNSGTVIQCYSSSTVDGNDYVGGLIGWNNGTVTRCFSTGTVTGRDYVGGLVGIKRGDVTQCYSTCVVIGNYSVGGMLGFNNRGNLTMCYSTGIIIGNDYVGGLVGLNRGGVTQCYSSGTVNGNGGVGGLIGKKDSGNVTDCFWDTQTSGQTISDGGTGKTTTEMKTKSTFTDAGWDFVGETANGPNDIWWINEGKDYPRLSWQGLAGMVFVDIPAGTFEMGDHDGTGRIYDRPVHTVTLDGFQMSRCETTNAQYAAYLNEAMAGGLIQVVSGAVYASADTALAQPYCDTYSSSSDSQIEYNQGQFTVLIREDKDMSDYPVIMVSWYGAKAFCDYYGCHLPTEAQWEYAARGGYHDPYYQYPWGSNSIDCSKANYHSSNGYCNPLNLSIRPWTSPVAYYGSQGAYGLCDMSGNVWEWCQDWFSSTYYKSSPANEPTGPTDGTYRVLRGGSWNGDSNNCRVDYRYWYYPYTRSYHYGFRVCR